MPSCSHGKIAVKAKAVAAQPQDTSHDSRGRISVYVWYKGPKAVYRVKRPGVIGRARAAYNGKSGWSLSYFCVSLAHPYKPVTSLQAALRLHTPTYRTTYTLHQLLLVTAHHSIHVSHTLFSMGISFRYRHIVFTSSTPRTFLCSSSH